jgi:CubicO group peptidase (beta-lactamase class C family)
MSTRDHGASGLVMRHSHNRGLVIAVIACLALVLPGLSPPALADKVLEGLSRERLQRLDAMASRYVEQGRLPGATLAVARNGRVVKSDSVGAVNDDSIFRIYSMSKPITTVAVLLLFEEGRLLLTDPVGKYLPEFSTMQVISGRNEDGSVATRPAQNTMTIKHLLTHTAGLTYDDETAAGLPLLYHQADIWSASSLAAFSQQIASMPLAFEPGTRWHYSVAQDVLGRLVEVVAGQPFDQYMQQRILQPLRMEDTGFWVPEGKIDRFLPLYRKQGDGMKLADAASESGYRNPQRVPYGGGGLVSTAADYLRFAQMLANGGELDGVRLLSRKTVDLMMMNHLSGSIESLHVDDAWLSNTENRSGDMHLGLGYGLGGYVFTDIAANAVPGSVGTYGWGGNGSTYFFVDRQESLVGLFLTQLSPSSSYPLRAQFRALVYQALVD